MNRRPYLSRYLAPYLGLVLGFCLTLALPGWVVALTTSIPKGDIALELSLVCEGLTSPVKGTHAGDRSGRLFIVDQVGLVWIYDQRHGRCLSEPFLDLRDRIVEVNPFFDERGLLGLAFHPKFRHNGRLFVRYSAPREGTAEDPCFSADRGCYTSILSEFRVRRRHSDYADPKSERVLLAVEAPQFNHNSGDIAFGGDGYLYIGMGDGGGAHDGLADTPPSHGPMGNGQNIDTLLGSMLRIDVDSHKYGKPYGIPRGNPFAGSTPGADEIYAYGFRNPYRFSFDRKRRGHYKRRGKLYVADVGQGLFEEVSIVRKGGNYGWVTAEGFHCFDPLTPTEPPTQCSGTGPHGEPLLNPVAEYNHNDGTAVIGGFVYRGHKNPSLWGKYVFGDFTQGFFPANGRLFYFDVRRPTDVFEFQLGEEDLPLGLYLFGFGQDEAGELYVMTSSNLGPTGDGGQVWKIGTPKRYGYKDESEDDDED